MLRQIVRKTERRLLLLTEIRRGIQALSVIILTGTAVGVKPNFLYPCPRWQRKSRIASEFQEEFHLRKAERFFALYDTRSTILRFEVAT